MIIELPFYENNGDGSQCLQVTMKVVLEYFLGEHYTLDELDALTGRRRGMWTWTSQIAPVLYDKGLEIKYYSSEDMEPYLAGEPFIREHFGINAEKILKFIDIDIMINSIKNLLTYSLFEKKKLTIREVEGYIEVGCIPLVMIDQNVVDEKEGLYQGHFVVVTGFDEENIYYHESGPGNSQANRKVSRKLFDKAFNASGTDNDAIIVFGKRK